MILFTSTISSISPVLFSMGDNLTGDGDDDDEQIVIDLNKIPPEYDSIVLAVNIYRAEDRHQHFGMIKNAFIRLVDANTSKGNVHLQSD